METLRKGKTSLLINPPEHENSPLNDDRSHESRAVVERRLPVVEGNIRTAEPCGVTDRFSRTYAHPDIDCKQVAYAAAKRGFDIVVATTILVAASPIMAIAALLVPLTSPGPIIFQQVRVGRGGRYFTCYKFRSMCIDAEEQKQALQHLNEANGPVFKIKHDPRFTPIGAFIRKFSIDELPQLINVLKGDMSIVGPRPPVPAEVENYGDHERRRLAVLPGLTCLWQISGRSNIPFERWVELDIEYIERMSFFNDVKIVAKTIPAVLTGAGAH